MLEEDKRAESLATAFRANLAAAQEVRKATDDLAVVHAVLAAMPEDGTRDVPLLVKHAKALEAKLAGVADSLDAVNETLRGATGDAVGHP